MEVCDVFAHISNPRDWRMKECAGQSSGKYASKDIMSLENAESCPSTPIPKFEIWKSIVSGFEQNKKWNLLTLSSLDLEENN